MKTYLVEFDDPSSYGHRAVETLVLTDILVLLSDFEKGNIQDLIIYSQDEESGE